MNFFDYRYTNAFTEYTNRLITDLNKQARSLSFEQLRYKVLFTTQATKLARFKPKESTYRPSNNFSFYVPWRTESEEETLANGFYVDTDLLMDMLK